MKILITGSNGFVGKTLCGQLDRSDHDVRGMDLKGGGDNVYTADLSDYSSVCEVLDEVAPEFIVHLAAVTFVNTPDADSIYHHNTFGTLNLLKASIRLRTLPRFLFVSSSQVYGIMTNGIPVTENTPIGPVNHYGASKAAAENLIMGYRNEYHLPAVIVRPFNHTGRGQNTQFIVPKLVEAFKKKERILSVGNLQAVRDYLDVRDVILAYIRIMENFPEGEVFNICSGVGYSIAEIYALLAEMTGHKIDLVESGNLLRPNEIMNSVGDPGKIRDRLGWNPARGIRETLEWMLME